jgi:hypothetical protein
MQKLELEEKRERKANMKMINSNELLELAGRGLNVNEELSELAMKHEDLYFLVKDGEVSGIAIPTYKPKLLEEFKNKKPIRQRVMLILEIIENGRRQEYILIML